MARGKPVPAEWLILPVDHEAARRGYWFDEEAAAHVCEFFERFLRHSLGRFAGEPFILQGWQRSFLSRLFGWMRPDGTRRFREALLEVPKKSGKSTLMSGLALYGMCLEPGAEVYQAAVNATQAGIIFRECGRMIQQSPKLRKHYRVNKSRSTITLDRSNGRLRMLSSDVESVDGINASMTILDELHRFPNRRLYDILKYAGAAREAPLLLSITTAGSDRYSICYEVHTIARNILNGATDTLDFLPVIYAAPDDANLDDPAVWRACNPSLGVTVEEEDFAVEWAEAKKIPAREVYFRRVRFNQWVQSSAPWLRIDLFDALTEPTDLDWFKGRNAVLGLDLSAVTDLTSMSLTSLDGDKVRALSLFWLPEDTIELRSKRDRVPYRDWADAGHAIRTPGNATDFGAIRRKIHELRDLGIGVNTVVFDIWNARQMASELIDDGFEVLDFGQSYLKYTGPCKELERRILAGTIAFAPNPILRWNVGNVSVEMDGMENVRPTKKKSTERIDGVVALVMSVGVLTSQQAVIPGCEFA